MSGKKNLSHKEWDDELSSFISTLLVEQEANKHRPHKQAVTFALSLLSMLKDRKTNGGNELLIHKLVLALLTLSLTHPEATNSQGFKGVIQEEVLDQYSHDEFLQASGNKLLDIAEDLVQLDLSSQPFQFPPFQKALPYFPSYGYQATLVFADDKLDQDIQRSIISLVTELKCKKFMLNIDAPLYFFAYSAL